MSSSDDESYKEKCENLKWLVHGLQRDLNAEKLRGKSVDALAACLNEEREKNKNLIDQSKHQERGIAVLQSRLEKLGENSALTLEDGEILRPGSSRTVLESLMAENAKLKQNQKYLNVDPARMEQVLRDNEAQKKRIKQLETNIESMSMNLEKAEKQLKASENDKDKRILDLEAYVSELKRNKDTQSVLCHSLSEETTSLRQQLKETMKQMQAIMRQLEQDDKHNSLPQQEHLNRELVAAQSEIKQLQQAVDARESRLEEVTSMNSRWQTYNKQRDQYVQELKQKLASQHQSSELQVMINKLHQEVAILKQQRQKLTEENLQLQERIKALQEENRASMLDQEKINVYEAQIKVITDDFKQERDDRAREHERAEKLEKELADAKAQLDSLQRQHMQEYADRRQRSLENYEQQYYQNVYGNQGRYRNIGQQQAAYVPRGEPRYECDADDAEDNDNNRTEDVVDTPSDDTLECPKCNKQFKLEQHLELIEHLDKCK